MWALNLSRDPGEEHRCRLYPELRLTSYSCGRERFPNIRFEHMDGLLDPVALAQLCTDADVIFVDIGGIRAAADLMRLLPFLLEVKPCIRLLIYDLQPESFRSHR